MMIDENWSRRHAAPTLNELKPKQEEKDGESENKNV
jgi:hypothetical protein